MCIRDRCTGGVACKAINVKYLAQKNYPSVPTFTGKIVLMYSHSLYNLSKDKLTHTRVWNFFIILFCIYYCYCTYS